MKLLNPSPGEIADRLAVLELKIDHGKKAGQSIVPYKAEKLALEERMLQWDDLLRDNHPEALVWEEIGQGRIGLQAVNALLWEVMDEIASIPESQAKELAELCKRMITLRRGRAELIKQVSKVYGLGEGAKMYRIHQRDATLQTSKL